MIRTPGKALLLCGLLVVPLLHAREQLNVTLSRTSLYPGEPALVTAEFHAEAPAERLDIFPPKASEFIVEKLDENRSVKKKIYHYKAHWLLIPKAPGTYTLPPIRMELYRLEPGSYLSQKHLFRTPAQEIKVLPFPPGVDFAGDLRLSAKLDRNTTRLGQAVLLTLRIHGRGDLRTLRLPDLTLSGAQVYESKPIVKTGITPEGDYGGEIIRRYTILAEHSLKIPPLTLRYLNSSTGTIERLHSPAFKLEVDNPVKDQIRKNRLWGFLSGLLIGLFIGALLLGWWIRKRRKKASPLMTRIGRTRDPHQLYRLLLPYASRPEVAPWIRLLEEYLYRGGQEKIDRKRLLKDLRFLAESDTEKNKKV